MEIMGLAVEGAGRFGSRAEVRGFGPGVNVLAAPNEAGKSTLFRALRACLFERHTTKGKAIEPLVTDGASLPVAVSIDFTHQGRAYTIRKSFHRSPSAALTEDGRVIAKNREADERLYEILGLRPDGGRSIDQAAFGLLWVAQGQSFTPPAPSAAGETLLGAAIAAEVGAVAGGERARLVLDEARAELAKYLTLRTGKPLAGGPLARAVQERDRIAGQLEAAQDRLRLLEAQFGELERARAEREQLADPALAAQHEEELRETRRALQIAADLTAKLAAQEAEERRRHALMETTAGTRRRLAGLAAEIDKQRQREKALAAVLDKLGADETARRDALAGLRAAIKEIETADEAAAGEDRLIQRLGAALADARGKSELERREGLAAAISERRAKAMGELAAFKVTADDLSALDDIERELSLLDARLVSSAAQVTVAVNPETDVPVLIGGKPVKGKQMLPVTDIISLSVGGIASITVSPPASVMVDYEKQRASLLSCRAKRLAACAAADLAEARRMLARRDELERELKIIATELAALGFDASAPDRALGELRAEIARAGAAISEALRQAGREMLPDDAELEERRETLARRREENRKARKALDATLHEHQQALEAIVAEKSNLSGELGEVRRSLASNLAQLPDERREAELASAKAAMDEAETAHQRAAGALADLSAKYPSSDELERWRLREARLDQAIANRKAGLADLDQRIANLEGQIQTAGGDGVGEKAAALQDELAAAGREAERHEKRARALSLLAATIEAALTESRERFHAPIMRHLNPFLRDLFPGADLALGDGFSVTELKRPGEGAERFERLSDGTREQIAVLVRLAMGALLAEQGRPVPIVLDDALVFSDDERIASMFDALTRAGEKQQVIVLTCRTRAFAALGGRPLTIVRDAGAAG